MIQKKHWMIYKIKYKDNHSKALNLKKSWMKVYVSDRNYLVIYRVQGFQKMKQKISCFRWKILLDR